MNIHITKFDIFWTKKVQSLPPKVAPLMKAATIFGQPLNMGIIIALCGVVALWQGLKEQVLFFSIVLVIIPLASVLKIWIHRARPATYTRTWMPSHSFPSGHAYSSLLVLGTVAYVNWSLPLLAFALLVSLLIGVSRIFRGAHYPTDVLGGWFFASIAFYFAVYFAGKI